MSADPGRVRLLLHTLRHLRPVQVWGRMLEPVRRRLARLTTGRPGPAAGGTGPGAVADAGSGVPHHDPWNRREELLRGRFTFLGRTADLGWPPRWDPRSEALLWRFNLHYHQYLHLLRPGERDRLRRDWVDQNPIGSPVAWHPYVLSRRIASWCRIPPQGDRRLTESLWRQADCLYRTVEWHRPGNHLLENARALLLAACSFGEGEGPERWARRGGGILREQLDRQVLADGVHAERSPMYHALVLEGLVDVNRALEGADAAWAAELDDLRARVENVVGRMAAFLFDATHPDGCLALLNDSTVEIAPTTRRLLAYAGVDGRAGRGDEAWSTSYPDAGYHVYRGPDVYLLVDGGSIGPDHVPAHAHADIFSYELDVGGRRLVVDAGVPHYRKGEMRDYARSTVAHNTVTVDGASQAECWDSFRVARRYPPRAVRFRASDRGCSFRGQFDGYGELLGDGIRHRRTLELDAAARELTVDDRVDGSGTHRVVSRIHLHPDAEVEPRAGGADVSVGGRRVEVRAREGSLRLASGRYCPRFGSGQRNDVVHFEHEGPLPTRLAYTLRWQRP